MEHTCSVEFRKIKSLGALNGAYVHNETVEGRAQAPNVNLDEGFHSLLNSSLTYEEKWRERITEAEMRSHKKITIRKDAVYAIECVFGLSNDVKMDKNFDFEAWEQQSFKWCEEQFGRDNIIGFTVHYDENTPHIHAVITPVTGDNRLSQKEFIGGPGRLHWLQSSYAKALDNLGLRRGIINSKSKHQDIQRLYNVLNQALLEKLPEKQLDESEAEYYERANKEYESSKLMVVKLRSDISREIRKHVAFTQRYHKGINFQNKIKEIFGDDDSDKVFSALENMSNDDIFNAFNLFLQEAEKKKAEAEKKQKAKRDSLDVITIDDNMDLKDDSQGENFTVSLEK